MVLKALPPQTQHASSTALPKLVELDSFLMASHKSLMLSFDVAWYVELAMELHVRSPNDELPPFTLNV